MCDVMGETRGVNVDSGQPRYQDHVTLYCEGLALELLGVWIQRTSECQVDALHHPRIQGQFILYGGTK